uniref:Uncharacterized protein n=1 Tax=Arundo donax TaxID=35708 RepID=A0A0A9B1J5_ARUDO
MKKEMDGITTVLPARLVQVVCISRMFAPAIIHWKSD